MVLDIAAETVPGPQSAAAGLGSSTAVQNLNLTARGNLEGTPPPVSSPAVKAAPTELPGIAMVAVKVELVATLDGLIGDVGLNRYDMTVDEAVDMRPAEAFADAEIGAGCADAVRETSGTGLGGAQALAATIGFAGNAAHLECCAAMDSAVCVSAEAFMSRMRRRGNPGGRGGVASGASHSLLRPEPGSQGPSSGRSRRLNRSFRSPTFEHHVKRSFPKTVFVDDLGEDSLWAGGDGNQVDHEGRPEFGQPTVPHEREEVGAAMALQPCSPSEAATSPEQHHRNGLTPSVPVVSQPSLLPPPPPSPRQEQQQEQQQQEEEGEGEGATVLGLGRAACGTAGLSAVNFTPSPSGRLVAGKTVTAADSQDHQHQPHFLQGDAWTQGVLRTITPPMSARRTPDRGRGQMCRRAADDDIAESGAAPHRRMMDAAVAAAAVEEAEGREGLWRLLNCRQVKETPAHIVATGRAWVAANEPFGGAAGTEEEEEEEEEEGLDDAHSPFQASDRMRKQRCCEGHLAGALFERNGGDGRRVSEQGENLEVEEAAAIASVPASAIAAAVALAAEEESDEGHADEDHRLDGPALLAEKQEAMTAAASALRAARSSALGKDAAPAGHAAPCALLPLLLPPPGSPSAIVGPLLHAASTPGDEAQVGDAAGDGAAGPPAPAAAFARVVGAVDVGLPSSVPTVSRESCSSDVHELVKYTADIRGHRIERSPIATNMGQLRPRGQQPGPCGGVRQALGGSESALEGLSGGCQFGCDASTAKHVELTSRQLIPLPHGEGPRARQQQQHPDPDLDDPDLDDLDLDDPDLDDQDQEEQQQKVAAVGPPLGVLEGATCLLRPAGASAVMLELAKVFSGGPELSSEDLAAADHSPPRAASRTSLNSVDAVAAAAAAGTVGERSPPGPDPRVSADNVGLVRYDAAEGDGGDRDPDLMQVESPEEEMRGCLAAAAATTTTTTTTETPGTGSLPATAPVVPASLRGPCLRPLPGSCETSYLDLYQRCLMQQQQQQQQQPSTSLPLPLSFPLQPSPDSTQSLLELIRLQTEAILHEGDLNDPSLTTAAYSAFYMLNLPLAAMASQRRQHAAGIAGMAGTSAAAATGAGALARAGTTTAAAATGAGALARAGTTTAAAATGAGALARAGTTTAAAATGAGALARAGTTTAAAATGAGALARAGTTTAAAATGAGALARAGTTTAAAATGAGALARAGTTTAAAAAATADAAPMIRGTSRLAQPETEGGDGIRHNKDRGAGEAGPSKLQKQSRGGQGDSKHNGTRPSGGLSQQPALMHTSGPRAASIA
ncbi:hypothetical protein VaNZ11_016818 [Volvox africanus]|uniref:Uncharacterized protein n=1 Tax=Volvox africanus TaxID=51714 RepID=A0ABQ5SQ72_9CHLO|nr:hypothetical protein VaNZ11_016818 [Volvox africanus]